jgi:hypothetical protein
MMLHKGDKFRMPGSGQRFRVAYVNECRAHCEPLDSISVTLGERTFEARGRATDIAPEAWVEDLVIDRRVRRRAT